MFEILKALMVLNEACNESERYMHWTIDPETFVLKVEVQVTRDDREFVEQARMMFRPV